MELLISQAAKKSPAMIHIFVVILKPAMSRV
ncbi:hypothetical protein SAMN05421779_10954 [Insolitispirillum peregrinum]|uniref:Uncharacterized protein n=1 Tax=Insolitispirillum peregrinum TaxID=80876 RepID=A0A1N7Q0Y5_9PROT|nr:hypothetical protein SAMN05421779_10954 [Insolitispirillum peregrinum]